ncbi:hypothetical protein B7494_g5834 [Chlorociboria aeruginascens]|nr:hypothetical protein B7494_g5834 [Chlorociboria aeruginascens]
MKTFGILSVAAAALSGALFATSVTADLPPIVIKGSHFFYENGTEFFIRGVAYQQDVNSNGTTSTTSTFTDPLADTTGCTRDIPVLQELGTNVIRVYAINASLDHSVCMQKLQDAGIYLLQDLSNPSSSINRNDPEWTTDLYADYAAVVDALANYTNVLGFFAGNEVSNAVNNTAASAFVKAAVRDMKAYIKSKNYRTIGVGYATNDDANIRIDLAHYFNCGDQSDAIDFWGVNIYSWCGDSSFTESGYDQRTLEFANYSVPAFFAEYGCNTPSPREFTEVQAIYGNQMTGVWSGGIVYMYFQETNNFGLVSVSGDQVSKLADFTALSSQLALATPSLTASADYTPTNTVAQACPATGADWAAASNLPPIANAELCSCMVSSLSCVANTGLSGNETATLFNTVCGLDENACAGINANATTGVYGAYSMCDSSQKLSFAFDQYYQSQGKASTACSFNSNAKIQSGSSSSSCSSLISQAGSSGTGTVTTVPTKTASSSKKSAAGAVIVPRLDVGLLQLGAYVLVAGMAGAGMIATMARLMDDSDEDFPNLQVLLGGSESVVKRKTRKGSRAVDEEKTLTAMDQRKAKNESGGTHMKPKKKAFVQDKTSKPKRRILKQSSDNPLLRPLANNKILNSASSELQKLVPARRMASRGRNYSQKTSIASSSKSSPSRLDSEGGLSDFIVDDSSLLDKDESEIDIPAPRSARRLVRGRRRQSTSGDSDGLDLRMSRLKIGDISTGIDEIHGVESPKRNEEHERTKNTERDQKLQNLAGSLKDASRRLVGNRESCSDIDGDPFMIPSFTPSENKTRKVSKETRFATPPRSPELKPRLLISPKKLPRVPLTPYRPSMDAFWSQDVINDWNDEFSPKKTPRPLLQSIRDRESKIPNTSTASPQKRDSERRAREVKKAFSLEKQEIAESFLAELDATITGGRILEMTAPTGGIKIIWKKSLTTTAGRANWKRESVRPKLGSSEHTYRHYAFIELADKVIVDEHRLLNVVAHEFCHLANYMISNMKTNPHGKEFKAWAAKCSRHFGDRGIEVTTLHSYEIDYKYIWECTNCALEFKRHSKSIDVERHRCGGCRSLLIQTKPAPRNGGGKMNEYQAFVKENMKKVMKENPGSPQKEIMGLVGKRYQNYKASKDLNSQSMESVDTEEGESTTVEGEYLGQGVIEPVARKLEFLDLTSP